MTTVEVQLLNMAGKIDKHIEQSARNNELQEARFEEAIEKLEERQLKAEIGMARLIGGLVVAQFLAILFAPVIRTALGLSV